MAITIPVAHDFICPWCWIAVSQANRLKREYDVEFDWLGYEQYPKSLDWPIPSPAGMTGPNRPLTPGRLDLALAAEGIAPSTIARPHHMRSHNAHLAVEYAKTEEKGEQMVRALYEDLFLRGSVINDPDFIEHLSRNIVSDSKALRHAIDNDLFADKIVPFEDAAHAAGVFNVPTFFIGGERYAEQPYSVLRNAVEKIAQPVPGFWRSLTFPEPPTDRPYTAVVIAQTADGAVSLEGKAYVGTRDDLLVMRTLEEQFDASLVGAETVRKAPKTWYSRSPRSFILSRSGDLPQDSEYAKRASLVDVSDLSDWSDQLRKRHGFKSLLIEGGPNINRQFFELGLVDEVFLTIAPTISMVEQVKTIIGPSKQKGSPISLKLDSEHRWGDELFVRYRVVRP